MSKHSYRPAARVKYPDQKQNAGYCGLKSRDLWSESKGRLNFGGGRSAYALRASGGTSPPVRCVVLAGQCVGYIL
jgi:hypothetical protein